MLTPIDYVRVEFIKDFVENNNVNHYSSSFQVYKTNPFWSMEYMLDASSKAFISISQENAENYIEILKARNTLRKIDKFIELWNLKQFSYGLLDMKEERYTISNSYSIEDVKHALDQICLNLYLASHRNILYRTYNYNADKVYDMPVDKVEECIREEKDKFLRANDSRNADPQGCNIM
jgi:hypothetical protein